MLNEKRGMLRYILLNLVTFGVYSIVFWWDVVDDVDVVCGRDDQQTTHILLRLLLDVLTLGVYSIIWRMKLASRISVYCMSNRIQTRCMPASVTLWSVLFAPVADWQLMKGMNDICGHYNRNMVISRMLTAYDLVQPAYGCQMIAQNAAYANVYAPINRRAD